MIRQKSMKDLRIFELPTIKTKVIIITLTLIIDAISTN